jgi:hypothetical protein
VLFRIIVIIRSVRFQSFYCGSALQFIDIQPLYQPKELTGITSYKSPLKSEFWKSAALANKHLVIIPARRLRPPYEPFATFAVRNHLTLNLGYFARSDELAFEEYRDKVWEDLKAQKSDAQTIYILSDPEYITFAKENLADNMFICEIDDFTVLFSVENKLASQSLISPLLLYSCSLKFAKLSIYASNRSPRKRTYQPPCGVHVLPRQR